MTESKQPLISVCVASYNHAEFLPGMLDSVLNQSFREFEIIIADDGSTDDSVAVLEDYSNAHDNLSIVFHPGRVNRGISATTNLAVSYARGKYIAFIGSDDMWYPYCLEALLREFEQNPHFGFVYGLVDEIDCSGQVFGVSGKDISKAISPLAEELRENQIPAISVLVRKACLEEVGYMSEDVLYGDWELWLRLLMNFEAGFIDRSLAMHRVHGRNVSIGVSPEDQFRATIEVLNSIKQTRTLKGEKLGHRLIREGYAAARERLAIQFLDLCFFELRHMAYRRGASFFFKSIRASPAKAISPRRILAVCKNGLIGLSRGKGISLRKRT